jgi:hypothetical protein
VNHIHIPNIIRKDKQSAISYFGKSQPVSCPAAIVSNQPHEKTTPSPLSAM